MGTEHVTTYLRVILFSGVLPATDAATASTSGG
jgi:hypothetical protein